MPREAAAKPQIQPPPETLPEPLKNEGELNDLLPMDMVDDLLIDDEALTAEEPDLQELALSEAELESLENEEPLDLLKNPALAVELSEDPVRLYLEEIGEIKLLGVDQEFWLATR